MNLNAPVAGVRPNPASANVIEVVSDAQFRAHQVSVTWNYGPQLQSPFAVGAKLWDWKRVTFGGSYNVTHARDNTDGEFSIPPGPLSDEWGRAGRDNPGMLVVANRFMEGERPREAVEDPACPAWGGKRGVSCAALRAPTFADALKLATLGRARVLSVGIKDRGALLLAGRSADLALFYDVETGELTSTTCLAPGPPDWLSALRRAHPVSEWKDWTWTLSRPEAVYARVAEERTEIRDLYGIGQSFPHRVGQGDVSPRLFRALRAAPPSTTIVLRAARAGVEAMQLGARGRNDLLLLALGGLDYVGHSTGTASRERVDLLLRMHDELGAFLRDLRTRFGDGLSVLLTADHGGTPIPATVVMMPVAAATLRMRLTASTM